MNFTCETIFTCLRFSFACLCNILVSSSYTQSSYGLVSFIGNWLEFLLVWNRNADYEFQFEAYRLVTSARHQVICPPSYIGERNGETKICHNGAFLLNGNFLLCLMQLAEPPHFYLPGLVIRKFVRVHNVLASCMSRETLNFSKMLA